MSHPLPREIEALLATLQADIAEVYERSSVLEFWTVFSARAARIRNLSGNEEVLREASRRLDQIVKDLGLADRRLR
ncbi:MAG: hypothetical protein ABWY34_02445 [Pseudoxanthomonas sp.]